MTTAFEAEQLDIVELTTRALVGLIAGEAPSCSGEDGLGSLEMVMAAHISAAAGGAAVPIPLSAEYDGYEVPFA